MANSKFIKIQKLDVETETWEDYYTCFAEVNKASGREYFNAKTNITQNTYNFKIPFIAKLEDVLFNTNGYRIIYKDRVFNIINFDDKQEKRIKITLVADCVTI